MVLEWRVHTSEGLFLSSVRGKVYAVSEKGTLQSALGWSLVLLQQVSLLQGHRTKAQDKVMRDAAESGSWWGRNHRSTTLVTGAAGAGRFQVLSYKVN